MAVYWHICCGIFHFAKTCFMLNKLIYIIPIVLLMAAGCTPKKTVQKEAAPVPVKVMKVEVSEGVLTKKYVGTAAPSKSVTLSASYSGTLENLNVSRGDRVRKGDRLAVIRSQNVLSMAESAEAALHRAEDGYKRSLKMYENGGIAEVKMVEIETQLAEARAAAKAAKAAVEDCTVKAPFDGTVSDVFAERGTEVTALSPLAKIYDISSMKISFSVPENEIGNIRLGDRAVVEVPALGTVSEDGNRVVKKFEAKVSEKGISGSSVSHSYECTLVPLGDCSELMPGMVCKISLGSSRGGYVLPSSLVRTDASGRYVWGLTGANTVRKIYITTGDFVNRGVSVLSGLEEGDLVITEGMQKVSTGMKVRILE